MATINRTIKDETERDMLMKLVEARTLPFTVTIADGKVRTSKQNRLQQKWMQEISEQLGDRTPEEARAYSKLAIGVPILRAENDAFRVKYDQFVKPLDYETKLAIMGSPLDMPVTRLMTTEQKTRYLDAVHRHFSEQGVYLSSPQDRGRDLSRK